MTGHTYIRAGEGVATPGAPYSPGVVAGDLLYVAGQVAVDPDSGKLKSGTAAEETEQAMTNLMAVLRAGGFGPQDLVFVTIVFVNGADFAAINEVYKRYLVADALPARMAFAAASLPFGAKVEIHAVARKPH